MKKFISNVLKSFIPATQGIIFGFTERNMKVHGFFTILVVLCGILFKISNWEWLLIFLAIGLVISAELFNTAIELTAKLLVNKLNLNYEDTRHIRDLAAGGVLIVAVFAFITGLYIFIPKILILLY